MGWSQRWRALTAEAVKQSAAALAHSVPASGQLGKLLRKLADEEWPSARTPRRRYDPGSPRETPAVRSSEDRAHLSANEAAQRRASGVGSQAGGGMRVVDVASTARGRDASTRQARIVDGAFAALAPEIPGSGADVGVPDFQVGDVVAGRYEIHRVVGAGKLWRVYAARHRAWGIEVAIKAPHGGLTAAQRRTLATHVLKWTALGAHPNIVYCHYLDRVDVMPLLVVEYREGGDLRAWMASRRKVNLRTALDLALQICHGLEHAHAAGLWHGGLRPENLLLDADGSLAIGDFGLSVTPTAGGAGTDSDATQTGTFGPYIAPEQWADSSAIDARTDIFALGVCFYEMFTGQRPYAATRGPRREAPDPRGEGFELSPRLATLLRRCVDWEPEVRPASAAEVREELAAAHRELFDRPSSFAALPETCWEADGWNNQAAALALLGHPIEADEAWERALHVDPAHLEATYSSAMARWSRGEISDATLLDRVTWAVTRRADDISAATLLAAVQLERGESDAAIAVLEAVGPADVLDEDGQRVLEAARQQRGGTGLLHTWAGHRGFVSAVRIVGDQHVLSTSDDGMLGIWMLGAREPLMCLAGHAGAVSALCASADGRIAISGGDDATLRVWNVRSGQCQKVIATPGKVFSVAINADATRAFVACSGSGNFLGVDNTMLLAWDLEKDRLLGQLEGHTDATKSVALSADGRLAASGSDDQTVRIWDLGRGRCRRALAGHEHYVSAVCLSADGALVVSGSWDKTVRVWDTQTGRCLRVMKDHEGIVNAVALSADGSTLVSGGWDRTMRIWETGTGRCLRTFEAHDGNVSGVALSADGTLAVSGSWDRTVRLWRLPPRAGAIIGPRPTRRAQYVAFPARAAACA